MPIIPPHRQQNLMRLTILIVILVAVAILSFPRGAPSHFFSPVENLAACLTRQNVTMYGVDTCAECQNQKQIFGNAFQKIKYVNCDFHADVCNQENVGYYPTWIQNDRRLTGFQSLPNLANWTQCSYEK